MIEKIRTDQIISVLDGDQNGFLDFKEFQQAIDLVGARLPDDRLRWSFRLYDMDNSGSIALPEMENVHLVSHLFKLYSYSLCRCSCVFTICLREWVKDPAEIPKRERGNCSERLISTVTES